MLSKSLMGIQDARSTRGILSRGPAKYAGPGKAPRTGNVFDVQKAAQNRLKKLRRMQGVTGGRSL